MGRITVILGLLIGLPLFLSSSPYSFALKVFSEDFEGGGAGDMLNDWKVYDEPGANSAPSDWHIGEIGGHTALIQSSNIYGGAAGDVEPSRGTWIWYKKGKWDNLTLEVDMYPTDDDIPGVLFHYIDEDNFYVFDMNGQANRGQGEFGRLRKCVKGEYTELDFALANVYDANKWHHIKIETQGANITVSVEGNRLLQANDDEIPAGSIALSSWGMSSVAFDDVKVNGQLIDNFNRDLPDALADWEFVDEPGANASPSNWRISTVGQTHALTQSSNIYGGGAGDVEPSRGTWAYYKPGEWSNAIIDVDMYATDDDIPGVCFRFVDENNHYIFDMNGQNSRGPGEFGRIRRCYNGKYDELADMVIKKIYDKNVWFHVKIVMNQNHFVISVDDKKIFDVVDRSMPRKLAKGTIAMSSWGMQNISFDNIKVVSTLAVNPHGKLTNTWGKIKNE